MKFSLKNTARAALLVLAVSAQFASTISFAESDRQNGSVGAKPLMISGANTIQGCNAGLIKDPATGIYVCSSYYQTGTPPPNVIPGVASDIWWKPGSVDGVNMPYYGGSSGGGGGNGGGCDGGCNGSVTDGSGNAVTSGDGSSVSSTGDGGGYSSSGGGGD
jgi:hypothetical protein